MAAARREDRCLPRRSVLDELPVAAVVADELKVDAWW
jgi:hypothetical protein